MLDLHVGNDDNNLCNLGNVKGITTHHNECTDSI